MNTRNIQTFLMVSAAFFAMSAPVRSNPGSAGALSNAMSRTAQVVPASIAMDRVSRSSKADKGNQNS
ncbi:MULTISPECIES: hypothetical protein [Paraburkholderia]|uniref:Uncharacterized protein n=1 Tax=Paraburkholderia fynbosensis TaxID=1200993 RepID=A0A6J5GVA2_9BURK|nr:MULTISPECIES: hypothetical protein [Paraburkholderia]RKT25333.1 hypothetical protein B0G69_1049 [Paraburkholderia sp. RAU2J]CAB3805527.1 hypothetical protein LMG27177_05894 [Paraburkholderia fynbosensis]